MVEQVPGQRLPAGQGKAQNGGADTVSPPDSRSVRSHNAKASDAMCSRISGRSGEVPRVVWARTNSVGSMRTGR